SQDRFSLIGAQAKVGTQYEDLIKLCLAAGAIPQAKRPEFWLGIASYLSLLEGNIPKAEAQLEKARSFTTSNKPLFSQLHVWATLIDLAKDPKSVRKDTQTKFMEDLAWARRLKEFGNNRGLYHSLLVLAGNKYLSLMDLPRSILCFEAARGPYGVHG